MEKEKELVLGFGESEGRERVKAWGHLDTPPHPVSWVQMTWAGTEAVNSGQVPEDTYPFVLNQEAMGKGESSVDRGRHSGSIWIMGSSGGRKWPGKGSPCT